MNENKKEELTLEQKVRNYYEVLKVAHKKVDEITTALKNAEPSTPPLLKPQLKECLDYQLGRQIVLAAILKDFDNIVPEKKPEPVKESGNKTEIPQDSKKDA